jgi:hypothetical protein
MITPVLAVTEFEVITNVAELAPPATGTDAGTDAAALLALKDIMTPPVGAGPDRLTVPIAEDP